MTLPAKHFQWYAPLVLALAIAVVYWPGLFAPFYLDDISSIKANTMLLEPDLGRVCDYYRQRCVGYASFWLNAKWLPSEPAYYRIVNLLLHWATACLVLLLTQQFVAKAYRDKPKTIRLVALTVALVFALHPIQVNAVTYVVQRLAVLAALFYLLVMWAYWQARVAEGWFNRTVYALLCLVAAIGAVYTKENTVTLPFALFLMEWLIIRQFKERWYLLPIGIALAAIALFFWWVPEDLWVRIDRLTRETLDITRMEYWQSQWVVQWIYWQKILLPTEFKLEYALKLTDFKPIEHYQALAGHAAILIGAWFVRRKLPLFTFGIAFFYATHFVESGIVPIRDLAFEHRNYLPLFGAALAVIVVLHAMVFRFVSNKTQRSNIQYLFLAGTVFLASQAFERNQLWADQGAFLKYEAEQNKFHIRSQHSLAVWYNQQGQYQEALDQFRFLFGLSPDQKPSILASYVATLIALERYDSAERFIKRALEAETGRRPSFGPIYSHLGVVRYNQARFDEAVKAFKEANDRIALPESAMLLYIDSLIKTDQLEAARQRIAIAKDVYGFSQELVALERVAQSTPASD